MADFFMPVNCALTGAAQKIRRLEDRRLAICQPQNYLSRLFEENYLEADLPAVPMQFSQLKTAADLTGDALLYERSWVFHQLFPENLKP